MTRGVDEKDRWGVCERCHQFFERRGHGQMHCLNCRPIVQREYAREQNKAYYRRNPRKVMESIKRTRAKRPDYYREQSRRNQAKRRERIRQEVLSYYSAGTLKCACCRETEIDFLTVDHMYGKGTEHRREAGSYVYQWLYHTGFPPGFQILCANCNMSKGKHGACVHATKPATLETSVERETSNQLIHNSTVGERLTIPANLERPQQSH
jgi:hypothetical protein